jgi:hypothetical protein
VLKRPAGFRLARLLLGLASHKLQSATTNNDKLYYLGALETLLEILEETTIESA